MPQTNQILILDDNEELLLALDGFLTNKNYSVLTATNGVDGLKLIEEHNKEIDLIITDLVMPSISGVAVISIVKEKYPGIPVIAITGWGEYPETLAEEAKADLVLEKPFELVDLYDLISKMLHTQ